MKLNIKDDQKQVKINKPDLEKKSKNGQKITMGIEIGSYSIKLVQIKEKAQGKELLKSTSIDIPLNIEGEKKKEFIAQAIKDMISGLDLKTKNVIFSLPNNVSFIGYLSMPVMSGAELKKAMRIQSERICPYPLPEAVVDFHIRGESKDKEGVNRTEVILTAARKQVIDDYLSIMKKVDLNVLGISLKPFALGNYFKAKIEEDKAIAVVDISRKGTTLVIIQPGGVSFERSINLGSGDITRTIAEELRLELKQAKEIVEKIGIPVNPTTNREKQIFITMRPLLERLVNEIERSFGFYSQQSFRKPIARIILTGEGANIKNFAEFLMEKFEQPLEIFPSVDNTSNNGALINAAPEFSTAIGLADQETLGLINLLPSRLARLKNKILKIILGKGMFRIILPVLVSLILISYTGLYIISQNLSRHLTTSKQEIKELKRSLKGMDNTEEIKLLEKKIGSMGQLIANRTHWSDVLKEISCHIHTDNYWLRDVIYKDGILRIEGSSFSQNLVADLVLSLSRSKVFSEVNLGSTRGTIRVNYKIVDFDIRCRLK